jgi:hypothetical protein
VESSRPNVIRDRELHEMNRHLKKISENIEVTNSLSKDLLRTYNRWVDLMESAIEKVEQNAEK